MLLASAARDWATIMTAFGTVAVAIAAVGVALYAESRADARLREQQAHSDKQLAGERALSEARLQEERRLARGQIEEERRLAQEREQLAEAYAVQVALRVADAGPGDPIFDQPDETAKRLEAAITNRGRYTITASRCGSARTAGAW